MVEFDLTFEQRECVNRALEGHNFSIFGEAGTGKSLVISEICKLKGSAVQVICSTGIACEVFQCYGSLKNRPITVHSFLGIGTGEGNFDSLAEKSTQNPDVRKRIIKAECFILDECSMSSSRVLKLYHKITTTIRGINKPFGGIQSIIVGDWLQLKPVPDKFDDGLSMFKSPLFSKLFPHTITLSLIHRQDDNEKKYKSLLQKLRVGVQWKIRPFAHFKFGAPVMVLYNVNKYIHNGTTGVFLKKLNEDCALIRLDSGGEYVIKKVSWTNADQEGKVIGSRYEIPLKLNSPARKRAGDWVLFGRAGPGHFAWVDSKNQYGGRVE